MEKELFVLMLTNASYLNLLAVPMLIALILMVVTNAIASKDISRIKTEIVNR